MSLIVRIRGHRGMKRVTVKDGNVSLNDLLQATSKEFSLPSSSISLSKTPLHAPQFIKGDKQSLTSLGIKNGDIIYLKGDENIASTPSTSASSSSSSSSSSSTSSSKPASTPSSSSSSSSTYIPPATTSSSGHKLTARCNHGPNGACPHCSGAAPSDKIEGRCNHASGVKCIHCSAYVKDSKAEPASWLCNHPESVFCAKCIPPEKNDDGNIYRKKGIKCDCDKSKGQECIRCIESGPLIKVDKIPFARFLKEKKGMCKYKHNATATCPMCAPPLLPSYAGKKDCNKGHAPWPAASCLSCAPNNAVLRQQSFRHCDSISIDARMIQPFYFSWVRRGISSERCAILFGRYVDEPEETKNPGAIRALVYALYEPPQESIPGGVKLLRDPNEKITFDLAKRFGWEPVGQIICNTAKNGTKYGGDVLMTGPEVELAARFQNRFKNDQGYSRFVSVILHHSTAQVEPVAYQISDMGVAMERDGVLSTSNSDPNMLATKTVTNGQIATVVYKDKVLMPGEEYLPDDLINKVVVTAPRDNSIAIFKYYEFPSNGGDILIQQWLQTHSKEDYVSKFSDFSLLIALCKVIGSDIVYPLVDAIKNKTALATDARTRIDQALTAKKLL